MEIRTELKKTSVEREATLEKEVMAYLVGRVLDKYP